MLKASIRFFFLSFLLLIAGCLTFENPLSRVGEYESDPRLVGTWYAIKDDSVEFIHISPGEDGLRDGIMVDRNKTGDLDIARFQLFTTPLKTGNFLNVYFYDETGLGEDDSAEGFKDTQPFFVILHYQITEKGEMILWFLNSEYLAKAVEEGRIKGEVDRGHFISVAVQDSSANLIRFLNESDKKQLLDENSNRMWRWTAPVPFSTR